MRVVIRICLLFTLTLYAAACAEMRVEEKDSIAPDTPPRPVAQPPTDMPIDSPLPSAPLAKEEPLLPETSPDILPSAGSDTSFTIPTSLTTAAIAACPATFPNGRNAPWERYPSPHLHGNEALIIPTGPGGKILPSAEQFQADGSINWKMGVDRLIPGEVVVTGRRLDAPAPPAQGHYAMHGYGETGFQAGWVHFPSEGCWEITVTVGASGPPLTFVVLLTRLPFEYLSPGWLPDGLNIRERDVKDLPETFRLIFAPTIEAQDQVTWDYGKISMETSQGLHESRDAYPESATQMVVVHGETGLCVQGAWDIYGQWQSEADAGTLQWVAEGLSFRISHAGLGLNCQDLLRIAGASS